MTENNSSSCDCSSRLGLPIIDDIVLLKAVPWMSFYESVAPKDRDGEVDKQNSSQGEQEKIKFAKRKKIPNHNETGAIVLSSYFQQYLQFLRWRRSEDQAEELELFVEMLTEGHVLWRFEPLTGNVALNIELSSGADPRFHELRLQITLPETYPREGSAAQIEILGGDSDYAFQLQASEELSAVAANCADAGAPSLLTLFSTALQLTLGCSTTVKSLARGMCPKCTNKMRRAKLHPTPVALKYEKGDWYCIECNAEAEYIPQLLYIDGSSRLPLVPAHAQHQNVFSVLQPVPCCSYCFDDEVYSFIYLPCGCWCCYSCFLQICDIAVGERGFAQCAILTKDSRPYPGSKAAQHNLEYLIQTKLSEKDMKSVQNAAIVYPFTSNDYKFNGEKYFLGVGIPCPNHAKALRDVRDKEEQDFMDAHEGRKRNIKDPLEATGVSEYILFCSPLMALLPPRTMKLFNFFSMEYALQKNCPGFQICPLRDCKNLPYISEHTGSHPLCPFCYEFYCKTCKEHDCRCKDEASVDTSAVLSNPYLLKGFSADSSDRARNAFDIFGNMVNDNDEESPQTSTQKGFVTKIKVCLVCDDEQFFIELPLDGNWFHEFLEAGRRASGMFRSWASSWSTYYLRKEESTMLVVFQGTLLDPTLSLRNQFVYDHAILFVISCFTICGQMQPALMYIADRGKKLKDVDVLGEKNEDESKRCPVCDKPVVHYLSHGCHIIRDCHIRESNSEWCYVCGAMSKGHQCPNHCPLFCDFETETVDGKRIINRRGCECPLCKTCKPMRPCAQCVGCPACSLKIR